MDRNRIPGDGEAPSLKVNELAKENDLLLKQTRQATEDLQSQCIINQNLRKQLDTKEADNERILALNRELQSQLVKEKTQKLKLMEREKLLQANIVALGETIEKLKVEMQLSMHNGGSDSSLQESQFVKRATALLKENRVEMERLKIIIQENRRKNTLLLMQLKQQNLPSRPPQSLQIGDSATSSYHYPSGMNGPGTNMTLSLVSSASSRRQDDYSDMRGYPMMGGSLQQNYMDMDKSTGQSLGISFDRNGPVEGSDHFYTNTLFSRTATQPRPLTPTEGREHSNSPTRKPPIPKPRARSTLRSGLTTLTQDGAPETFAPETFTSVSDTYEIIDRPPGQYDPNDPANGVVRHPIGLPLNTIPERSTPSATNLYTAAPYDNAIGNNHPPNRLQENVTQLYPAQPGQMQNVGVSRPVAASATVSNKVCAVCNKQFGDDVSESDFNNHCIECADNASEGTNNYPIADTNKRVCPMCSKEYGADNQIEFENHVQTHFQDEPPGGWEQVSAATST